MLLFFGMAFICNGIIGLINGNIGLIGGRTSHSGSIGGNACIFLSIGFIGIGLNFLLSILDVIKNRKDYGNGALLLTGMACLIVGAILFAMKK